MNMHNTTFEFIKPSDDQIQVMQIVRSAAADYARVLDLHVPDGSDKEYILRKLREVAMWVNVAITRNFDGAPRENH